MDTASVVPLLVLLDIDGLLVDRVRTDSNKAQGRANASYEKLELPGYVAFLRPGAREFLDCLFEVAAVGIWSSGRRHNVQCLARQFLSRAQYERLVLLWDRDHVRFDPDYGKDPDIKSYDSVKVISDVIENPTVNPNRQWTMDNVLLVDDSARKTRLNPPTNVCVVDEFDASTPDQDDTWTSTIYAFIDAHRQ